MQKSEPEIKYPNLPKFRTPMNVFNLLEVSLNWDFTWDRYQYNIFSM